jgi:hypothetical protein
LSFQYLFCHSNPFFCNSEARGIPHNTIPIPKIFLPFQALFFVIPISFLSFRATMNPTQYPHNTNSYSQDIFTISSSFFCNSNIFFVIPSHEESHTIPTQHQFLFPRYFYHFKPFFCHSEARGIPHKTIPFPKYFYHFKPFFLSFQHLFCHSEARGIPHNTHTTPIPIPMIFLPFQALFFVIPISFLSFRGTRNPKQYPQPTTSNLQPTA